MRVHEEGTGLLVVCGCVDALLVVVLFVVILNLVVGNCTCYRFSSFFMTTVDEKVLVLTVIIILSEIL